MPHAQSGTSNASPPSVTRNVKSRSSKQGHPHKVTLPYPLPGRDFGNILYCFMSTDTVRSLLKRPTSTTHVFLAKSDGARTRKPGTSHDSPLRSADSPSILTTTKGLAPDCAQAKARGPQPPSLLARSNWPICVHRSSREGCDCGACPRFAPSATITTASRKALCICTCLLRQTDFVFPLTSYLPSKGALISPIIDARLKNPLAPGAKRNQEHAAPGSNPRLHCPAGTSEGSGLRGPGVQGSENVL